MILKEKDFVMFGYYTPEEKELMARNEARLQECKDRMGSKWILHSDNKVTRNTVKSKTLGLSNK